MVFEEVNNVLNNPAVKVGLQLAGPQVGMMVEGIQALMLSFASQKKEYTAHDVLRLIDKRAAELIEQLSKTQNKSRIHEIEIRLHELLEIGQRWDRTT